jgi:hypothetical protein
MTDYPNRSDLRNPATRKVQFTGQTYGEGAAQNRSQQMVSPGSAPVDVEAQRQAVMEQRRMRPGAMPLTRPSERPDEPITAGADFGEGPGSMASGVVGRIIPQDPVIETLRALYSMYPNDGLAEMIQKFAGREGA